MELKFRKEGDATVLELKGRLDTSNYESFSEELFAKLEDGDKYIIMDMEDLDYISSSGLRVFLSALKKIRANEGDIALCCMSDKINEVFEISGFSSLFKVFVSLSDAVSE
ncbi:MAG: STAS domain-containing protein [Bacteroidales bacterium]|nr:STAS domain-containing protein [Bacteroidales bacterium]